MSLNLAQIQYLSFFIYFIISTYQYMMPLTLVRPIIQGDPSFHKSD